MHIPTFLNPVLLGAVILCTQKNAEAFSEAAALF